MDQADYGTLRARLESVLQETEPARAPERVVRELKLGRPDYTWVGIYLLEGSDLVLGPYLGKPSPHVRIPVGRGICGAAAAEKQTVVVDDVNADERYLACSLETRSEIVVPIMVEGRVVGEIDIDSDRAAAFGERDRALLEWTAARLGDIVVGELGSDRPPGSP